MCIHMILPCNLLIILILNIIDQFLIFRCYESEDIRRNNKLNIRRYQLQQVELLRHVENKI